MNEQEYLNNWKRAEQYDDLNKVLQENEIFASMQRLKIIPEIDDNKDDDK